MNPRLDFCDDHTKRLLEGFALLATLWSLAFSCFYMRCERATSQILNQQHQKQDWDILSIPRGVGKMLRDMQMGLGLGLLGKADSHSRVPCCLGGAVREMG